MQSNIKFLSDLSNSEMDSSIALAAVNGGGGSPN
jgi:hypothetical protein